MAIRILPFRQYSDHEVVNLYALTDADVLETTTLADSGGGDAGVFVKISDGDFDNDPITYQTNTYLGDNSFPFLGGTAMYPQVNLKVTPATAGTGVLGITLLQTAKNDENGEKLLYNPTKQTELQAALPGQAVPVATKGIFTVAATAIDGTAGGDDWLQMGQGFKIGANEGKITGCDRNDAWNLGSVLGTGTNNNSDFRAPSTGYFSGAYAVIKLDIN